MIPARNEARNLRVILPQLPDVAEVILVDGGSTDGTVDVALEVMPDVSVIQQTRRGKGNALVTGFEAATGDIIVMFDADGSADAAEISRFVAALVDGADFAKGSRNLDGGGSEDITRLRHVGNAALSAFANSLFRTRFTDLCYGYNAFWRDILETLELPPSHVPASDGDMLWGDGFEIETVLNCRIARAGLVVAEVPSLEKSRIYGVSNLNAATDGLRVLRTILHERRRPRAQTAIRAARIPHQRRSTTPTHELVSQAGPEIVDLRNMSLEAADGTS